MSIRKTRTTTSHWGAFTITAENDRIVSVGEFENDPKPSAISMSLPAAVHHRTRVARPSIRKSWLENGPQDRASRAFRGKDEFLELPWDEALEIAANEITRIKQTYGNEAIYGGSYGWASAGSFHHAVIQVHRFLSAAGGYVSSVASYSMGAAEAIIPHIFGMNYFKMMWSETNSWSMIAEHTQTLVMFGGINSKNSQISMGGVTHHETAGWFDEFESRGIRLVNISPQATDATKGAEWLAIKPGSDTAMMLGIASFLDKEGLADEKFLDKYCVGYEHFRSYLNGTTDGLPKTPEWAASLCGIDAQVIRELAISMVNSRTLITVAWSLQRAEHGEQPYWMAATLAAMLGQIGLPGGGVGYGYGAIGGIGVSVKKTPNLMFPLLENAVTLSIPVARIADMLLNPGKPFSYNGQNQTYPDIKMVYWSGGNPFHHHQDLQRLDKAWKKPETIIVNEPWWTATAKRADIVFPATTAYERHDIGLAEGDSYLFDMPAMISPVGEARDDYDIFHSLAKLMGFDDVFSDGRSSEQWLAYLYDEFREKSKQKNIDIPSYDALRESNWIDLPIRSSKYSDTPFAEFRKNPELSPLKTPSGKIEIHSDTIANFNYTDCPGHPTWLPPVEWLGSHVADQFPLHLVSPQPADKLHSQLECAIADIPGQRPAPLTLNPIDAQQRGINANDIVRVFNSRGACLARAHICEQIMAGVVSLYTGAWYDPDPDSNGTELQGNPNVLTQDVGTSNLGQGSSAHSCLVDVERLD